MTPAKAKAVIRSLKRADEERVRELYLEVFGAEFAGGVTVERARNSIAEALVEKHNVCYVSGATEQRTEEREHNMTTETPASAVTDDLIGTAPTAESAPPAEAKQEQAEKPAKVKKAKAGKPGISKVSKPAKVAKPKAEKKPFTPKVILLRDPEIVRRKDGSIQHIIGKCTWKEGGKFACDETRKIHAADAFQVRYCKAHKAEAVKLARRNASKAKRATKK